MAHRKSLEALNRTFQDLRDNTNVMEGVLLMLPATENDIVNGINNIIQEMIPGEEKVYMSIYTMTDEQKSQRVPVLPVHEAGGRTGRGGRRAGRSYNFRAHFQPISDFTVPEINDLSDAVR
ncbi:hypothetical protein EVAR_53268_1 [Eumeta japonica]|uniref:Uncharacterized protein n=1 Tax=Eumeta variegata TaxID=151549 RepID=A0A4C1YH12_EUMVA|nr:hypothetical protein EVAR_53268_1 [Eumeta japonica]